MTRSGSDAVVRNINMYGDAAQRSIARRKTDEVHDG